MIARGRIATAPAPTPWIMRATISAAIDGARAQPTDGEREQREPREHHGLAAEPVGQRPDHDRRRRKAGQKDRDRRGRLSGRRAEIGLHQADARQGHVGGERRKRREPAEQRRQSEPMGLGFHPSGRRALRIGAGSPRRGRLGRRRGPLAGRAAACGACDDPEIRHPAGDNPFEERRRLTAIRAGFATSACGAPDNLSHS